MTGNYVLIYNTGEKVEQYIDESYDDFKIRISEAEKRNDAQFLRLRRLEKQIGQIDHGAYGFGREKRIRPRTRSNRHYEVNVKFKDPRTFDELRANNHEVEDALNRINFLRYKDVKVNHVCKEPRCPGDYDCGFYGAVFKFDASSVVPLPEKTIRDVFHRYDITSISVS